jgi:hypothetical protein
MTRTGFAVRLAMTVSLPGVVQGCAAGESQMEEATGSAAVAEPVDFRAALNDLAERHGVAIVWQGGPYSYTYDWGGGHARDAAEWEIAEFAPVLIDEMNLYPTDFFPRVGINRVVLARDLWLTQEGVEQNISGYIFDDALLLSVSYTYKVNNRDKQRRYMHHLVWHLLDGLRGTTWEDPEWVALNPEGFEYGVLTRGGIHDRSSATGLLSTEYPGFVNRYGTGNIPDDKADLFAYLMVVHHWVDARANEDRYLRAKVNAIKTRLAAFDPAFDEDFWKRIDAIRRDTRTYLTP